MKIIKTTETNEKIYDIETQFYEFQVRFINNIFKNAIVSIKLKPFKTDNNWIFESGDLKYNNNIYYLPRKMFFDNYDMFMDLFPNIIDVINKDYNNAS